MTSWIWVLTFTILGSTPEHGTISKFNSRTDCEERLKVMKQEANQDRKQLVGSCSLVIKAK